MDSDGNAFAGAGMADSLLQEIAERLAAFANAGEASAIDLRSLPMAPSDRDELEERLGHGDVSAMLDVAGRSEVWETGYAGVWWVRHFGAGDAVAAERIEITAVPEILVAHSADIACRLPAPARRARGRTEVA